MKRRKSPPAPKPPAPPAARRRGRGRPSEFTEEARDTVVRGARVGLSWADCASLAGVSSRSIERWRKQGEADEAAGKDTEYCRFCRMVLRARAQRKLEALERIEKHAKSKRKDAWKAESWFLAASDPETFGRRRVEMTGKGGKPVRMHVVTGVGRSPEDAREPTEEALHAAGVAAEEDED